MKKFRLFLVLLLSSSAANAAMYRSYEFADASLSQRADLVPLLPHREFQISDESARDLVRVEVRGVVWNVSPEIADFLKRASSPVAPRVELPTELRALAEAGDAKLDDATLRQPAGQIRVMLRPLVSAGIPAVLAPLFADPDFVTAAQEISRTNDVTKTALTNAQKIKFATLQGALLWRLRGGGLYVKTSGSQTWRRLFVQYPMSTLASLGGASAPWAIGAEFWAGLMQSWGRYFDIGHFPNQEDRFHDLAEMVRIGARLADTTAADLEARGYDASPLRIAGRQFGACYDFAWENLASTTWGDRSVAPYVEIAGVPTQWGELCAGAGFGAALLKTLGHRRAGR